MAQARDAFHLLIPSLPGYGFSGRPTTRSDLLGREGQLRTEPFVESCRSAWEQGVSARKRVHICVGSPPMNLPSVVRAAAHQPQAISTEVRNRRRRGSSHNRDDGDVGALRNDLHVGDAAREGGLKAVQVKSDTVVIAAAPSAGFNSCGGV
jgi:hypothetical protein